MTEEAKKKLRVLIVDDHTLVRDGLKAILSSFPLIKNIHEATDGKQAVEKALELKPDLVLMDIQMPKMNGLEALKEIKKQLPKTKVIMLTIHGEETAISQAIKS